MGRSLLGVTTTSTKLHTEGVWKQRGPGRRERLLCFQDNTWTTAEK